MVGVARFELATLCSQSRCAGQTALHSDDWCSRQDSNLRPTASQAVALIPLSYENVNGIANAILNANPGSCQ